MDPQDYRTAAVSAQMDQVNAARRDGDERARDAAFDRVMQLLTIDEHRDAADSGFLGAYPMPEVASVDDWWCSGQQYPLTYGPELDRWIAEHRVDAEVKDDDADGWF